jgi:aminoglycoside phosphotransferase (APT) family kinase protein
MTVIDAPTGIRKGEELNLPRLQAYLASQLADVRGGTLVVEQFPSGYSNLTYLLRMGGRELVLRRPPFGAKIHSAHDMGREYKVLCGLIRVYPKVPRPLLFCEDTSVIDAPFYIMERVRGVILRAPRAPQQPQGVVLAPDLMHRLSGALVDNLAAIHALDYIAAGLGDLGRPDGYIDRQISGWTRRYRNAQTDEVPDIETAITWLEQHKPAEASAALIHNDYKYDNVVLDAGDLTRIIAVLDWEMCTLGDPLMDLGTMLGYWIEPNDPPALKGMFGLTSLPGNLDRNQVVDRYRAASGREIPEPLFYYVFGLFKIAAIIQQIYFRYRQGHTHDARFARLSDVVQGCGAMAALALEKGRIHHLTT